MLFGNAVEYKHNWSQAIERAEKAGIEPPSPIPHPDDIILDPNSGGVTFAGPMTKEQRATGSTRPWSGARRHRRT